MIKRAAIYARYSSDRQNGRSIEDQLVLCRELCARNGWQLAGAFTDAQISGATLHRPGFADMLARAIAGEFELIVTEDTDRLARGEGDMPQLRRRLEFHGVEVHTISDGQVTKLVAGLKGLTASIFLDNLALHTRRGMAGAIRAGRRAGGRCYGYRVQPDKPGEHLIDEAEAAVIRRIFSEYVEGKTPRQIAGELNADRIAPPRGTRWNASTINGNRTRGHGILLNAIYAGRLVWNRVHMVKDPSTGRRLSRANPIDQHQHTPAPRLRIVDEAVFDQVQAIKHARAKVKPGHQQKPRRILSGLLRCGCCGGGMTAVGRDKSGQPRMICSTRKESGQCRNGRTLYIATVEQVVLDGLRKRLAEPKFLARYLAAYNDERRQLARHQASRLATLERQAGENRRELDRVIKLLIKGMADDEAMRPHLAELQATRDRLARELVAAKAADQRITIHPQAIERYQRDLDHLAAALAGRDGAPGEAADAFRRLVAQVVIHVDGSHKGAPWHVEIKGRLAALVGAAPLAQAAYVDSMVAGNRYRYAPIPEGPTFSIIARRAA